MKDFFNKFKIPTLLGLGIIFVGIATGVYIVLREQAFLSKAAPDFTPQNIAFTNISDDWLVISFQTNTEALSFITFGQNNPTEQTALDDRDTNTPKPRSTHYISIKNLLPKTTYQFKIISGKIPSATFNFTTASPIQDKAGFNPIIGSVLDGDTPLGDGIAYLSIPSAVTQSAKISSGNFLIPLSQIRKEDLSGIYPLTEGLVAKLTIVSSKGEATLLFKLKLSSKPLPPFKIGQNIDLTAEEETPSSSFIKNDLTIYDLNGDGKINAADNSIILQNLGKNPKNQKADLNEDGEVNQKDLNLMSQKLKSLGSQ
ncbi:hypothetical protein HY384_02640 [Candidatus Daviesbacteria bacterium]|nr:hypothetical protein [Candidatus Daviesbacteria bacterium]